MSVMVADLLAFENSGFWWPVNSCNCGYVSLTLDQSTSKKSAVSIYIYLVI